MIEQDVTHAKHLSSVLPLAALKISKWEEKINKCVYIQHSNEKAIHSLEFWSSNENSRQHWRCSAGIGQILFERVCGLWLKMKHFCGIMACLNKWSFWWLYNFNSYGNYLQRGTTLHTWFETDLSVLTMTFWDTRKKEKKEEEKKHYKLYDNRKKNAKQLEKHC